jgi:hypothetical protein
MKGRLSGIAVRVESLSGDCRAAMAVRWASTSRSVPVLRRGLGRET